jgi:superfamily II DNA helicase RecQ
MFPFLHDEERKVNNGDETIWKNNRNTSTSSFFQNQNEQLPQKSLIDKQTAKKKQRTIEINTDLFLELKEMRNQIVSQAKFKDPKIIFTDTELYKMCEDMPEKYEDIRGEKTRVDKYGMVFFQIIQKFKRAKMVKPNVVFRNSSVGGNGTSKIRSMKGVF